MYKIALLRYLYNSHAIQFSVLPSRVYNSMVFSIFIKLCSNHDEINFIKFSFQKNFMFPHPLILKNYPSIFSL